MRNDTNANLDTNSESDIYETLYNAYNDIITDLKEMLKSYPEEYRTYIETDEANEHSTHNDFFYHPLVTLNIFEAYGNFYLTYTRFETTAYLCSKKWLDITRCILKHTAKEHTAVDIEEFIQEYQYKAISYQSAVCKFTAGDTRYQPHIIKGLNNITKSIEHL